MNVAIIHHSVLNSAHNRKQRGSTLLMVLVLTGATLMILGSILSWTTSNVNFSQRNNEYFRTVAAAESATEKVVAAIAYDYQTGGDAPVQTALTNGSYSSRYPLASENPIFSNYLFTDGQGHSNKTYVEYIPPAAFRVLTAQYRDLYGFSSVYRIISNARDLTSRFNITSAVWQEIETATIPLFQFAIFYNLDLEINPGPVMTVTGTVHSNHRIFLQPQATLTFQGDVTSAEDIIPDKKPGDPLVRTRGSIVYPPGVEHDSGVSTLNLPIGTNNTTAAVHEVVMPPPTDGSEAVTSPMGAQRLYNKADVLVKLTDAGITVTSGIINNKATDVSYSSASPSAADQSKRWINTSRTLYNKREDKIVKEIEIDVAKLVAWNGSTSNTLPVRSGTGGTKDVTIIYVDDQRTMSSTTYEPGVLVKNGHLLPPLGLTIVTPEPIYVAGNYNVTDDSGRADLLGSLNTSHTKPAALIGDAITVLSTAWDVNDSSYGNRTFANRTANNTTVNAAFLAGIVETVSGSYSGGVENFPRFLEDWSNDTLTYSGSMVVMYPSQIATGLWQGTGSSIGIYSPPSRNWAFDLNFRDPSKLPPGTPCVRVLVRGAYAMIKPNTTDIVNPNEILP